jgi:hypothetical protein
MAETPSRFETHLALRHPGVTQLPGGVHDELLGWLRRQKIYEVMQLQFGFGVVKACSTCSGMPLYRMLTSLLDELETIMERARLGVLKSSEMTPEEIKADISKWGINEINDADRESIMAHTYPRRFDLQPDRGTCQIAIQIDIGYWGKCSRDRADYAEIYCVLDGERVVYEDWGFFD